MELEMIRGGFIGLVVGLVLAFGTAITTNGVFALGAEFLFVLSMVFGITIGGIKGYIEDQKYLGYTIPIKLTITKYVLYAIAAYFIIFAGSVILLVVLFVMAAINNYDR